MIAWGHPSDGGTYPALLYRVDSAGHATAYGTTEFTDLDSFSASPVENQFAFSSGVPCENGTGLRQTADLMNTATGAVSSPAFPAGQPGYLVAGTWFDRSGTPYVSLVPATTACVTKGSWRTGVAPVVCKLVNGAWVKTGSGVFQVGYGPGNWLVEYTGVMGNDGAQRTFTISNGVSRTTVSNVIGFVWAP